MIIFLFGPDNYRSQQRLNDIKKQFIRRQDKNGWNVSEISVADLTPDEIRKRILSSGLFAEKRMIIVKELLSKKFSAKDIKTIEPVLDELLKIIKKTQKDQDNVLIFLEQEIKEKDFNPLLPDLKKIYSLLKKEKYAEEFKLLSPAEVKIWIKRILNKEGLSIETDAADWLIAANQNNLWSVKNELDKIIALSSEKKDKTIKLKDFNSNTVPNIEQNIWKLIDAFGDKNKKQALKMLSEQTKNDKDLGILISLLARQYQIIMRIKAKLKDNPIINQYRLAEELSLHSFICQKALAQEKKYTFEELKKIYQQLLKIDLLRKTSPLDGETLLDLLIINS
jgi:DNA polymerase-3 subunit delta